MKIALIGNCQIEPLQYILEGVLGPFAITALPAVHMLQEADRLLVEQAIVDADWIIAQAISDAFPIAEVRTSVLRERFGDRAIVWPSLYFGGYAPEYGVLPDPAAINFRGPLFDYHSDKIVFAFLKEWSVAETVNFVTRASATDQAWYGNVVEIGLAELRRREAQVDIPMADFIAERFARERLFYVMNHPSNTVLCELAARIAARMAFKDAKRVAAWMLADRESVAAFHHESPYCRQTYKMSFPETPFARGYQMIPQDNLFGSGPHLGLLRLYTPQELVETFFAFYEKAADRLRDHPRVRTILARSP